MVAPPYAGHLSPLLVIAQHLRERGAQVTVATGPAKLPTLRTLGFAGHPVLADDPEAMERIADTTGPVTGHPGRAWRQVRDNLRLLPRALVDVRAAAHAAQPELIVADFCAPVAGVVASEAGVPWITTVPTPFAIENRRGTPAYLGGWTPYPGWPGRVRDLAGRLATRAGKHLAGRLFRAELAPFGGSLYRADGSETFYSDRSILALGLPELEFDRDWPAPLEFIGPITALPNRVEAPSLLAEDRPRVLVTAGTHLPWAKRTLVGQVVALAERLPGFSFVVSLGDASLDTAARRVAPRVQVMPFVSYDAAMGQFEAVVHHGGAGITYSTLRAGLPSVVWPRDYDQFDFAARLAHHGLAMRVRSIGQAVDALPRAVELPREPLDRFAALVRASDPLAAIWAAVGRARDHPRPQRP